MFISIILDLASKDSETKVVELLREYGIKKTQIHLFESFNFLSNKLGNLKKDLLDCVDMYDKIRLYQFPLENTFKISYLESRKWKRLAIKQE